MDQQHCCENNQWPFVKHAEKFCVMLERLPRVCNLNKKRWRIPNKSLVAFLMSGSRIMIEIECCEIFRPASNPVNNPSCLVLHSRTKERGFRGQLRG